MKNDFAVVREQHTPDKIYLFVDTTRAMLRGMKWGELGAWGRRKFENRLFLERIHSKSNHIKVIYEKA